MRNRMCLRILLAVLLLLLGSVSFAGTVSGIVTNGTTGKPAAGVNIILIALEGAMQPVAQTKSDVGGHYQLDNPALGNGPMLIRAVYGGVNYHEPATPGKTTVDIEVFEATQNQSAFSVTARAIILEPSDSGLVIDEEYLISNRTQPPLAYYRSGGSFEFLIPVGAQLGDVQVVGTSGMPVKQAPVSRGKNAEIIDYPFRPGETSVRLSYKLAYPGNRTSLKFASPYSIGRVAIFAPPSVEVAGDRFAVAGQQQGFNVFMRESVAANTVSAVNVSGTGPIPQPESSAGGAADDSQNPGVNSRADSGRLPPSASLTALPARLDSVRWYVVGGFAAVFALGLFYIWRQPRVAAASSPVEKAATAPERVQASSRTRTPDSRPSNSNPVAASSHRDREVRGSLDELKDVLFRLELRREAGTISDQEYTSERDRVQQVLRELVKG